MNKRNRLICLALALCMVFTVFFCGCEKKEEEISPDPGTEEKKDPSGGDPDTPDTPKEKTTADYYNELSSAVKLASGLSSFVIDSEMDYKSDLVFGSSGSETHYEEEGTETYETSIYSSQGSLSYLRLVSYSQESATSGELQQDGVRTSYYLVEYQDGSLTWKQSAAKSGCSQLPSQELFLTLPAYRFIKDLKVEEVSGDGTRLPSSEKYTSYSFSVSSDYTAPFTVYSDEIQCSAGDISIVCLVDSTGVLASSSWTYTQILSDDQSVTTSSVSYVSYINSSKDPKPLTWFEDSSTYEKPTYGDFVSIAREFFCNVPDKIIYDVRIPELNSTLTGAAIINNSIYMAYEEELSATEESLSVPEYQDYMWKTVDFCVYTFGSIKELCITTSEGLVYSSDDLNSETNTVDIYVYDTASGRQLSGEEFLSAMGYSTESLMKYASGISWGDETQGDTLADVYTQEELMNCFYIDGDGELQFVVRDMDITI